MKRFDRDALYRSRDILAASVGLVLLSPVILATAALIRAKLGSPVLFVQERPGLRGAPFRLVKFRSMLPENPEHGLIDDEARLTSFGQFLRSSSLDELPSLVNVLRGDLSLVGPRPLLMEYLDRYTPTQARRHEVRPGITGLAQINGRNASSWEQRLALDVWYVDHRRHLLDAEILVRTILQVLRRSDISAPGHATMPKLEAPKETRDTPPVHGGKVQGGES